MKAITEVMMSEAVVGKELATDLKDGNGNLVLLAGTILSAKVLEKLKARGIQSINLLQETGLSEEKKEITKQQHEKQLATLFRQVVDIPLMQELRKVLLIHRLRDL